MIELDGAHGEGGGQILRTALALACHLGIAFRIDRIRANRAKPGLRQQHLTAVRAAAAISGATLEGAQIGSHTLTFRPAALSAGDYEFQVGTAGSTMLVLQTVLPPLLLATKPSRLVLEGGTHNPNAPPFEFIDRAFLPLLNRMGPRVEITLERHGFYPAGGGRVEIQITPRPTLLPLRLRARGALRSSQAVATVARLPLHIAEREIAVLRKKLEWPDAAFCVREVDAYCPGNVVTLILCCEHITEVFCGFGARGVRAEDVARDALAQLHRYLESTAVAGEHLADQLLLPLALAGGGEFTTSALSPHFTTNRDVIRAFLNIDIITRELAPSLFHVELR